MVAVRWEVRSRHSESGAYFLSWLHGKMAWHMMALRCLFEHQLRGENGLGFQRLRPQQV